MALNIFAATLTLLRGFNICYYFMKPKLNKTRLKPKLPNSGCICMYVFLHPRKCNGLKWWAVSTSPKRQSNLSNPHVLRTTMHEEGTGFISNRPASNNQSINKLKNTSWISATTTTTTNNNNNNNHNMGKASTASQDTFPSRLTKQKQLKIQRETSQKTVGNSNCSIIQEMC